MEYTAHLSQFNKYTARTEGADKVFRVIGYFLRIILARSPNNKPLAMLVSALSECRVLLRFFGLPQTICWFRDAVTGSSGPTGSSGGNRVEMLQIASMLVYYPMEHIYYLSGKGLLRVSGRDALSRWSCRAWFFYMALDVVLLCRRHEAFLVNSATSNQSDKDVQLVKARLKLIAILADMPLALTWSLSQGFLSDYQIGILGTISSLAGIINSTI